MAVTVETPRAEVAGVVAAMRAVVGDEHVLTGEQDRAWYAADFTDDDVPLPVAVARPASTADVVEVVNVVRAHGLAIVGRGGGMSYTLAHTPQRPDTIVVDLRRMDRIVEINTADRYVTVEPGVTWFQLREALRGTGMRIPFHGTLSGLHATVGGGLSQNAVGLGRGFLVDSVLGLEVVLGDGRLLTTGSAAAAGAAPFWRNFGPDLSGLFLCDSGAFGLKTRATLRLDPEPKGVALGCFGFETARELVAAEVEIAATDLASECIGADAFMNTVMAEMPHPPRDEVKRIAKLVLDQIDSRPRALRQLARAARPGGMKFLAKVPFSLVVICDAADQAAADRNLARLRRICKRHGGRSLPTGLALGMRYAPFQPIHPLMVGKHGEAGMPSNLLFPLSRAQEAVEALDAFMAERAGEMQRHGVYEVRNYLISGHFFGIEPILFWPDRLSSYRASWASEEQRAEFADAPSNAAARECALGVRRAMIKRFRELGAVHLQLGKVYPFKEALAGSTAWDVIEQVKDVLDPDHLVNPGVLGLD
ncbi:MAG TPA: FAD-binding oxidoreductase [Acidimicrobiia bacterium]